MDPSRFDGLARGIARLTSRRTTLAGLLAGLAVPLLGEADAGARTQRGKHQQQHRHDADKSPGHAGRQVDAEKKKKKKKKCKGGTVKCGKICVNSATDRANCGACGKVCAASESCQGGACTCDGALCPGCCAGGVCQAGTSNGQCGARGVACVTCDNLKTNSCVDGVCKCGVFAACGANEQCCGDQCVNVTTVQNCGTCGKVCPGLQTPNSNVTCQSGATCTFSCQGDAYDVDGNPANGCEQVYTFGNHTPATATSLGSMTCDDNPLRQTVTRSIFSDARTHQNPTVPDFDSATGAAPQWWVVDATGGPCTNDLDVKLTISGGTGDCYKLTVKTDKHVFTEPTSGGVAHITAGAGSYSSDSQVFFGVEKTCDTKVREAPTYTLNFHL